MPASEPNGTAGCARSQPASPALSLRLPVDGVLAERGWTISLHGRIDQLFRQGGRTRLREIKTVMRALPDDEAALRADYPAYFVQLAAYAALARGAGWAPVDAELVFVEADSGLVQCVPLARADELSLIRQVGRVAEFLDLCLRGRERRRSLCFRPAFPALRPGQETVRGEFEAAIAAGDSAIVFEAPTGFGKTGVLLELALGQLRSGRFDRVLYLTGKSTGQLQVVKTLDAMAAPGSAGGVPPAVWHVRNKAEHCVNSVFHCLRDACEFIDGAAQRWPQSGLARFYLLDGQPHDLESLRESGRSERICPYEITRAALAFQDVWIGDYNYVFAPSSRSLFYDRPGFAPGRTLLVIDEAHNLPGRVAGAYSHSFAAGDALATAEQLAQVRTPASLATEWDAWSAFLVAREHAARLDPDAEEAARIHIVRLASLVATTPLDLAALGPWAAAQLWQLPALAEQLEEMELARLWWSPRGGELAVTCLDAAPAIGASLREFGGVLLATATPGPIDVFGEACGATVSRVVATTPWREGAYDVAYDVRADTTFQHRARYHALTAATIASLRQGRGPIAVFFPSYAYAEAIAGALSSIEPSARVSLQPQKAGLAAQADWVQVELAAESTLFLVLGSSFAESIDLLGGRVSRAMVVGPALPEVNALQRARLATFAHLGRKAAFRRVYQVPGMQKVNQALGRLVRAPGQSAKVLLHCRRFAEPEYAELLAADYRNGVRIGDDGELDAWLAQGP